MSQNLEVGQIRLGRLSRPGACDPVPGDPLPSPLPSPVDHEQDEQQRWHEEHDPGGIHRPSWSGFCPTRGATVHAERLVTLDPPGLYQWSPRNGEVPDGILRRLPNDPGRPSGRDGFLSV